MSLELQEFYTHEPISESKRGRDDKGGIGMSRVSSAFTGKVNVLDAFATSTGADCEDACLFESVFQQIQDCLIELQRELFPKKGYGRECLCAFDCKPPGIKGNMLSVYPGNLSLDFR